MKVTVTREIPNDPELAKAWNALVDRTEHPEVFFTFEWAFAAQQAFGSTLEPLLCLFFENDELIGIASLATDRKASKRAFFLGASTADYCDVVSDLAHRGVV